MLTCSVDLVPARKSGPNSAPVYWKKYLLVLQFIVIVTMLQLIKWSITDLWKAFSYFNAFFFPKYLPNWNKIALKQGTIKLKRLFYLIAKHCIESNRLRRFKSDSRLRRHVNRAGVTWTDGTDSLKAPLVRITIDGSNLSGSLISSNFPIKTDTPLFFEFQTSNSSSITVTIVRKSDNVDFVT